MKELLECTQCDKKWERVKSRGRKPIVCPDCFKINKQQETEQNEQKESKVIVSSVLSEPVQTRFSPVSYWMCPNCDQTISVHVGIDHIPIHPCPLKRNQMLALEQTTKKRIKQDSL